MSLFVVLSNLSKGMLAIAGCSSYHFIETYVIKELMYSSNSAKYYVTFVSVNPTPKS